MLQVKNNLFKYGREKKGMGKGKRVPEYETKQEETPKNCICTRETKHLDCPKHGA